MNREFGLGMAVGVILTTLVSMFVVMATDDQLNEGDRVCVEYVDADGYFCGPLVFTKHDDVFRG